MVARHASDVAAESGSQKEMQRKMLLAMAADLRIVLMRLASRLRTLRWHAESKTPCTVEFARETLDLYAPLANRLGIWQIKWEMEDLAFRFLEPDRYKQIARLLEEKRVEREAFIAGAIERLQSALPAACTPRSAAGPSISTASGTRCASSVWTSPRCTTCARCASSSTTCATAIRRWAWCTRWTPIAEEFDDYISRLPNGYRSLHTVVADHDGRPFEVQIRTREMHQFAEYGMAAHWRWKPAPRAGRSPVQRATRQLSWMRQLLAWNSEVEAGDQAPVAPAALEPARPATRGAEAPGRRRTDPERRTHLRDDAAGA